MKKLLTILVAAGLGAWCLPQSVSAEPLSNLMAQESGSGSPYAAHLNGGTPDPGMGKPYSPYRKGVPDDSVLNGRKGVADDSVRKGPTIYSPGTNQGPGQNPGNIDPASTNPNPYTPSGRPY